MRSSSSAVKAPLARGSDAVAFCLDRRAESFRDVSPLEFVDPCATAFGLAGPYWECADVIVTNDQSVSLAAMSMKARTFAESSRVVG